MIFSKWPMEMPPAMWIIKGWTKTLAIRSDLDSRLPGFRLLRFGFLGVGNQNRWPYAWIWTDLNMSKASVWHKLGITRAELHVLGGNSSFKKKFLTKASSSFCFYAKNMFNLTAGLRACVVHTVLVSRVFFCKPSPAPPGASAPCIGSVIFFPSLQWLRSCDINDVDWMCILCWADFGEATSRCGHARATVLRQEWSVCVTVKKNTGIEGAKLNAKDCLSYTGVVWKGNLFCYLGRLCRPKTQWRGLVLNLSHVGSLMFCLVNIQTISNLILL